MNELKIQLDTIIPNLSQKLSLIEKDETTQIATWSDWGSWGSYNKSLYMKDNNFYIEETKTDSGAIMGGENYNNITKFNSLTKAWETFANDGIVLYDLGL